MRSFTIFAAGMILAASPLAAASKAALWKDFFGAERSSTIPKKVRKFVIDAQACMHYSGEVSGEKEIDDARGLPEKIKKLCTNIEKRHETLLLRYRGDKAVEAIIAEVWEPFS